MKKYVIIFGLCALVTNSVAFAQGVEPVVDPPVVVDQIYQISVSVPRVVFRGTLEQLQVQRTMLQKQIIMLQDQLSQLDEKTALPI